jgi:ABC-2 type transport system permease protein
MTTLTGVGRLIRFILRRDRVRLTVWIVAISGMTLASAGGLPSIYPDQAAVEGYVALFGYNPALIAFAGPGYGFEKPDLGLVLVNETQLNGSSPSR